MPHEGELPPSPAPFPMFPGEEVIFRVRPNFIPIFFILFGVGVLGIVLIIALNQTIPIIGSTIVLVIQAIVALIVGFALLIIFLSWLTTFYTLTNKRVDERFGIIGQHSSSILIPKIGDVQLKLGVLGQILGYGDVIISGENDFISVDFRQITNPKLRASQVEAAME